MNSSSNPDAYFTSDVELWRQQPDFQENIVRGTERLLSLSENLGIPLTLFISLSSKGLTDQRDYLTHLSGLIESLSKRPSISLQPHLHMAGLPLDRPQLTDPFNEAPKDVAQDALRWSIKFLNRWGQTPTAFRAGSYMTGSPEVFYTVLASSGIRMSSSVLANHPASAQYVLAAKKTGISELPISTFEFRDFLLRRRSHEFSPDFSPFRPLLNYIDRVSPSIVINYHSFKVLGVERVPFTVGRQLERWIYGFDVAWNQERTKTRSTDSFIVLRKLLTALKKQGYRFRKMGDPS